MSISDILFGCEVREGSLTTLPALLKARFPYGNYLVLTDEESALALGKVLKKILKKLVLVIGEGEDVLPLFASPDAVTCVLGAGKAVSAARYFACARSLPFVAVSLSWQTRGTSSRHGHGDGGRKASGISRSASPSRFCRFGKNVRKQGGNTACANLSARLKAFALFL